MSEVQSSQPSVFSGSMRPLWVMLALVVVAAFFVLWQTGHHQREQQAIRVQHYLSIVADGKADGLHRILTGHFDVLADVAANDTLTLYLSELEAARTSSGAEDTYSLPELNFIRMMLQLAAVRGGFEPAYAAPAATPSALPVPVGGVALLNMSLEPLVMSRAMPPVTGHLRDAISKLPAAEAHLIDIYGMSDGRRAIAFAVPIFAVQGTHSKEDQRGWLVGVRVLEQGMARALDIPVSTYKSLNIQLLRRDAQQIELFASSKDGITATSFDVATPSLAASELAKKPASFTRGMDASGQPIMAVARTVEGTRWLIMTSLEEKEAMQDAVVQMQRVGLMLGLVFMILIVAVILFWRRVGLERAGQMVDDMERITGQLGHKQALLDIVTKAEPDAMFICDSEMRYAYANLRLAREWKLQPEEMIGKPMPSVIGPHEAARHESLIEAVLKDGAPRSHTHQLVGKKQLVVLQTSYIPIDQLPGSDTNKRGVLVIDQDVTALALEKDKAERLMARLVGTLMSLIDKRDHYAADHSNRVAQLAGLIAAEMKCDEATRKTVEIAGNLMNLGKIFIPEALLTQEGKLKPNDLKKIRESIITTADLLQPIEFEGPVAETIRHCKEFWNGSGLLGLKGEKILLPARIIAVANAFIGLASDRAFRKALPVDDVIRQLLDEMGTLYDRAVVVALANLVVSRGTDMKWLSSGKKATK